MSTKRKFLMVIVAASAMIVVGWGLLAAAVYSSGGFITVKVDNPGDGVHFTLPVPAVIVSAAVATADHVVPEDEWFEIRSQLGIWGPYVEGVLEALDDAPNAILVEVVDGREHVVVRKLGNHLKVDIDGPDISVHVSVPTKLVRNTVSRITT